MDQLTLINKALMKCGLPQAAALNDCDWNAASIFDCATDEVLRSYSWGFATRYASLTAASKPAFGFDKAYTLPGDCVKVLDVRCHHDLRAPAARYVLQGRTLLTNVTPANVRYISRNADMDTWPADFADAVSWRIALEIAALSAQTMGMVPMLMQGYQTALAQAQAQDARECMERVPLDHNILMSRAGLGEGAGKGE